MPLEDKYLHGVHFVLRDVPDEDTGQIERKAVGTSFQVGVPSEKRGFYLYVVTARHVVDGASESWLRVVTNDGGVKDLPIPEWSFHEDPDEDVAVAALGVHTNNVRLGWFRSDEAFVDEFDTRPQLGSDVYFIGLLGHIESMVVKSIPMVRGGVLGAWNQERVPVKRADDSMKYITAHLIDCRSYGGFSGSPCVAQYENLGVNADGTLQIRRIDTPLLGLISGHFPLLDRAEVVGDFLGKVRAPINTGVGIVTPVERIRETLYLDDLVAHRREQDKLLPDSPDQPGQEDSSETSEN